MEECEGQTLVPVRTQARNFEHTSGDKRMLSLRSHTFLFLMSRRAAKSSGESEGTDVTTPVPLASLIVIIGKV